jgi:hypothetical protein
LLVIVNEAFPVLVKVVVRTGLVWPTVTLPKLMLVGFSVNVPAVAVVPNPESGSVTVESEAVE